MPAKSKAQQAYMAIAEHAPSKLRGPMPNMSHAELHKFAATPTRGLPQHVRQPRLSTMAGVKPAAAHGPAKNLGPYCHPKGGY